MKKPARQTVVCNPPARVQLIDLDAAMTETTENREATRLLEEQTEGRQRLHLINPHGD